MMLATTEIFRFMLRVFQNKKKRQKKNLNQQIGFFLHVHCYCSLQFNQTATFIFSITLIVRVS